MRLSVEPTTIADDLAIFHDGTVVERLEGLAPDREHEHRGRTFRTLRRPPGELLTRIATVNDVHFGETECGRIDDHREGPILSVPPGATPYPEVMNRAAVAEIAAAAVDAVFVKGDLSTDGTDEEFEAFERCYGVFGDRRYVVRGNHDAYRGQRRHAGDRWVDLPGLTVGLLDTVVPLATPGSLSETQLAEIEDRVAASDRRVLLLGHHQQWTGEDDGDRDGAYFGLHPDPSDALDAICARHRHVIGYAAGHTHRHRVRRMTASGVPTIEIGCVKDFPGSWAEYRVYEGGVMQVVHRISDPDALAWSESCRVLYSDFGVDYAEYALGRLADRCFVFPDRSVA